MEYKKGLKEFTKKYLEIFKGNLIDVFTLESDFGNDCLTLEFIMDCGESFIKETSVDAFNNADCLKSVIDSICNVEVITSGIYSKWRAITHWEEDNLTDKKNKEWFIIALVRLGTILS